MKVATHHSKRRVNYVREDCTTERGSNQGSDQGISARQRGRNPERAAGGRSGEADTS